ncbi:hypothetical protein CLAIMM_03919 [Cladophialophora immunda]|nr:hypothetical protein CLAIMM_03919 [Cladophialophora immunda]
MEKRSAVSMRLGASRSRPGVHEKRTDAEPRVYCELPSFPSFDEPIPPEASLEEICIRYPNHLRGSYLDAFIQWHWSATDMYSCLSGKAINEFKSFGITTCKSFANRANFLMKRLDSRLSALSADEVTALCTAPKMRSCMVDGTEKYGASKLQGKFHNPMAPVVRRYPHRQGKERRSPQPSPLTRTFVHNGKEHQLWGSPEEFHEYKQTMATHWGYQRARAEQIIAADAKYRASHDARRNRLILQMTNWPCNTATETFFSFQHIQSCPAFESAMFELVVAAAKNMLDSFPSDDPSQQLLSARQAAVSYVLTGQEARLARLNDFLTALPAGGPTGGLVDQVLSWTADVDGESPEAVEPDLGSRNPQGEEVSFFLQSYMDDESTPQAAVPVAPSRSNLKRRRSSPAIPAPPTKRVRFANAITEFGPTDPGVTVDLDVGLEEPHQDTATGFAWPDWDLDQYPLPDIDGEDVFLTLNPPMDELLEEFDMDSLPWNPLAGDLNPGIDSAAADYSVEVDETESEWAQILSEAFAQDDVVPNANENEPATSWELPELVDNDEDWLREAIANASETQDEFP